MNLRASLEPLLRDDGLVALLVLSADGLPVEMYGYGLRADELAAELASVAGAARRACGALGLGEPVSQRISLGKHRLDVIPVGDHFLATLAGSDVEPEPSVLEAALDSLREVLEGETWN